MYSMWRTVYDPELLAEVTDTMPDRSKEELTLRPSDLPPLSAQEIIRQFPTSGEALRSGGTVVWHN